VRALFALAIVACGGGQPPAPAPIVAPADATVDAPLTGVAAILVQQATFTDEMCRCTDKACADRVNAAMTKWGQELPASDLDAKVGHADAEKLGALLDRLNHCFDAASAKP
jgi:hypothetical protein